MGAYGDELPATPFDTGRMAYRLPGEPKDERPLVWFRDFWSSPEEMAAYLTAVRNHPREVDPERDEIESSMAYIVRIASIVAKQVLPQAAKRMPSRWSEPARPVPFSELSYEERLGGIYAPREPGEEG